jgi:protein phosphatase
VAAAQIGDDGRAVVAHVGDARAFLIHGGALARLTVDHSLVEDARRAGVSSEELGTYPEGVVTRALGMLAEVAVEAREITVAPGDALLLATDGLTKVVGEAEIAAALAGMGDDLEGACAALTARAVALGEGKNAVVADNVAVVVVRVVE